MVSSREEIMRRIAGARLVPAVRTRTGEDAVRAMKALHAGGISVFEVPLTVPGALAALSSARALLGEDVVLGSGTVLDGESARTAILAGAQFLVSPSFTPAMVEVARRYGVPAFCGALTPTEVLAAWQAGADCVKVFPASAMGGPAYLRSLRAPLPQVLLMPMGGVTLTTAGEYLQSGAWALGIGADLVRQEALDKDQYGDLEANARSYCAEVARHPSISFGLHAQSQRS